MEIALAVYCKREVRVRTSDSGHELRSPVASLYGLT